MAITAVHGPPAPDEERPTEVAFGTPVDLTVAFTDLEDFTAYTESEGDNAASWLLIGHHRKSAPIVHRGGGRVLKWLGDGLMLTFPTPDAAVLACLELLEAAPLPLRAGIHGGTALVTADDVVGRVVNLAARVAASAMGGELLITDHVRNAVGRLHGVAFDGPHPRRFKGISATMPVYVASRQDW